MKKENDPVRNRPAEKGEHNDPFVRDEDARQPGASTISSNDQAEANQDLTETTADNFREDNGDRYADPRFDETGEGE